MIPVTRTGSGTKDMAAIMERVRRMSDSQLADILAGKDVSIPQFAAMTEAMGRKQLRQAVDGAQAQQQAQQPSIKDQLLAEQQAPAGLDQLPAPNMESIDMAGGGIIAFADTGVVGPSKAKDEWESLKDYDPGALTEGEGLGSSISNFFSRSFGSGKKIDPETGTPISFGEFLRKQEGKNVAAAPDFTGFDAATALFEKERAASPAAAPAATNPNAVKPDAVKPGAGLPAIDVSQATKFERRANPFGQMSAEKVDFEGLKDKGLGEGLMKLGAGLLSAPGSKGLAAGIQALAESGQVSRKEIAGLKKDARDYDLNIKKADAAFEQGNDELGLKYTEAANLNKYRMASLAQKPGELRTLEAIAANPQLAALYKGGKGAGVVSRTDALKEWNDLPPGDKRKLQGVGVSDFNSYYSYLSTGLPGLNVVDTLDKGAKVRS